MARTRKALVASLLVYIQFAAAIAVALVSVPLVIDRLGARVYGIWLASGETLAYVALLDFGILGVLPWMIAEADGRGDRDEVRRLVANGFAAGLVVGAGALLVGATGWMLFADRLTAADRAALTGPFALLVALTAITSPMWVFSAVLGGLQDTAFSGIAGVARVLLNGALTIGLLLAGAGLYALAVAAVLPPLTVLLASFARLAATRRDLLRGWPRPSRVELSRLLKEGLGGWIGAFGWRLIAASHNVVIAFLGMPEAVPVYACTARLSQLLTQLAWVLPDSGAVGLAQLVGEKRRDRVRAVVDSMLRLYLLLGGAVAAGVLAFNPAFVVWWVGPGLFGGLQLNAWLAAGAFVSALAHGLAVVVSVPGDRLRVGLAALAQGGLQIALAIPLGRALGLNGIALAAILAAMVTLVPVGLWRLHRATGVGAGWLVRDLLPALAVRSAPVLALAVGAGMFGARSVWAAGAMAAGLMVLYMWLLRPVYAGLTLDARVRRVLVRLRLLPVGA